MMSSMTRRATMTGAMTILAAPALVGRALAATTLKVSTSFPNDPKFSTARIWYDLFLPRLKAATDGQVTTQFFPDNQLGQEVDVVNQVKLGVGMGIGLFAPPLGLGLYGSCLIGGVRLEETVLPIMKYLGLLLLCLLLIAFVPQITTFLPRLAGY